MLVKSFVLLLLTNVLEIRGANPPSGKYCSAFRHPGTCMPIKDCPELKKLNDSPYTPYNIKLMLLRARVCPGSGGFCCKDVPNVEGIQKLEHSDTCEVNNLTDTGTVQQLPVHSAPWMAILIYESSGPSNSSMLAFGCEGTLISEKFVLTSARCLFLNGYKLKQVRLGDHYINQNSYCKNGICESEFENYGIEKTIIHERYANPSKEDNIALVKLAGTVEYKPHIRPICLPFDINLRSKFQGYHTIGWGNTENLIMAPLKAAYIYDCGYSNTVLCQKDSQICVANIGSPLVNLYSVNGTQRVAQVGIATFSEGPCGTGSAVTYTNLGEYIPWISHKIIEE